MNTSCDRNNLYRTSSVLNYTHTLTLQYIQRHHDGTPSRTQSICTCNIKPFLLNRYKHFPLTYWTSYQERLLSALSFGLGSCGCFLVFCKCFCLGLGQAFCFTVWIVSINTFLVLNLLPLDCM